MQQRTSIDIRPRRASPSSSSPSWLRRLVAASAAYYGSAAMAAVAGGLTHHGGGRRGDGGGSGGCFSCEVKRKKAFIALAFAPPPPPPHRPTPSSSVAARSSIVGSSSSRLGRLGPLLRRSPWRSSPSSSSSSSSSSSLRLFHPGSDVLADALTNLDLNLADSLTSTFSAAAASTFASAIHSSSAFFHELAVRSAVFLAPGSGGGGHDYANAILTMMKDHVLTLSDMASNAAASYGRLLVDHPLPTKCVTASILAVLGDAAAQLSSAEEGGGGGFSSSKYDVRRATSFLLFAVLYTGAFQHYWFGWLNDGPNLLYEASLHSPALAVLLTSSMGPGLMAVLKVALNQGVMIPFVYMPLFFGMTGAVGGLSVEESLERARGLFIPLLTRNYAFWLPAQLIQFAVVPPEWQITYLCAMGLVWTAILSAAASGGGSSGGAGDGGGESGDISSATANGADGSIVLHHQQQLQQQQQVVFSHAEEEKGPDAQQQVLQPQQ